LRLVVELLHLLLLESHACLGFGQLVKHPDFTHNRGFERKRLLTTLIPNRKRVNVETASPSGLLLDPAETAVPIVLLDADAGRPGPAKSPICWASHKCLKKALPFRRA
jgi:hypothetical protein